MSFLRVIYTLACLHWSGTVIASIEFTIATGPCDDGAGLISQCDDSAAGGLCASTSDVEKKWCCPPDTAQCGTWGETCTGAGNLAGPGQIYCQSDDGAEKWCCNSKYDICVPESGVFNLCRSQFASPYANTSEEEALRLKSAFLSTAASTQPPSATSASSTSSSVSSSASSSASSTSSGTSNGSSSHTGLGGGAIAGIVIGAVAGVAILALLAFFLYRQQQKNGALKQELNAMTAAQAPAYSPAPWPQVSELDPKPQIHEMGPGGHH